MSAFKPLRLSEIKYRLIGVLLGHPPLHLSEGHSSAMSPNTAGFHAGTFFMGPARDAPLSLGCGPSRLIWVMILFHGPEYLDRQALFGTLCKLRDDA